jgi:hypothetical protein
MYSYADDGGTATLKPLSTTAIPSTLGQAPTTMLTTKQQKQAEKQAKREANKQQRGQKRQERQAVRQEKRATRKAKRLARKLLRAKDRTGRKKWFYPISRVFKGKKRQSDGTIVDVAPTDIVTTRNGAQFDKNEISKATGVPPQQVTTQLVESVVVTNPQPSTQPTENSTLTPFIQQPPETAFSESKSVEEFLSSMTMVYAPVSENKELVQGDDGAMYMSDETTSQEEPPITDEEFEALKKKKSAEEKKGLGVWGWVGISAIVLGLGVGGYLLYNMANSKK